MKTTLLFSLSIFVLLSVFSCGSHQNLKENIPATFDQAYYSPTSTGLKLTVPVQTIQDNRIQLTAAYFHGMKSPLVQNSTNPQLYEANFRLNDKDVVMDIDPKKEYGNQMPQLPEESPVTIKRDEALLVFTENGQTWYYKLDNIVEKE